MYNKLHLLFHLEGHEAHLLTPNMFSRRFTQSTERPLEPRSGAGRVQAEVQGAGPGCFPLRPL